MLLTSTTFLAQNNRVPAKGMDITSKDPHFTTLEFTRHAASEQ